MAQKMAGATVSGRSETMPAATYADAPVSYGPEIEAANRRVVATYLNLAFNTDDMDRALRLFVEPDLIQHGPKVGDGAVAMAEARASGVIGPQCYDLKFVLVQNDLAWVYSKVTRDSGVMAVVDMMRVRDGKIVESWDVVQAVPDDMPHDNGMF